MHFAHRSSSAKAGLAGASYRALLGRRGMPRALGQTVEAVQFPGAAELDQPDLLAFAGFEANRRAGGNRKAHAEGGSSIEFKRAAGLEEMVVTADLHRPVAVLRTLSTISRRPTLISISSSGVTISPGVRSILYGWRPGRIGSWTVTNLVPSGKVASTWIIGIRLTTPGMTCAAANTGRSPLAQRDGEAFRR